MPHYHDITHRLTLAQSRSKGDFATVMERELGYHWDGTMEGKISLIEAYFEKVRTEDRASEGENMFIQTLESRLLPVLAHMEHHGVCCDREKLAQIGASLREDIQKLELEIYDVVGEFFNLNSPKQIQVILFEKLGIKPLRKNKTGYSVDTEVLEEIAKTHDIARLIIEHRTLAKLESTYIEGLTKSIDRKTGRIHTTYGQLGAATGRMSSNDPNLQNIPTGKGYPDMIKSCFIPSEGNILIVADYSQIELRVLAFLSQDHGLLEAFSAGEDIHMRTARYLFPDCEITGEERRIAKTVNFGVIYGITGFGLSKTLGCSPYEATEYINAFYARYPRVRAYYDEILMDARACGYVETYFGRRRRIDGINDANKMQRSIAEREAMNMPIQGTAADMIKLAMVEIDARIRSLGLQGSMILQVHDELVFDVPEGERDMFYSLIREVMEGVIRKHEIPSEMIVPPFLVDIQSGYDWVSAKG